MPAVLRPDENPAFSALLARTRREPRLGADGTTVHATESGYVVDIDLDLLQEAVAACPGEAEIVLEVQLGSHVVFGDPVATVVCPGHEDTDGARSALPAAISLDDLRDIDVDAGYGVDEIGASRVAGGGRRGRPGGYPASPLISPCTPNLFRG
ncbi:DUF2254 family protein [Microbispora sp. NPDC046973]|uniref:DUF2254 family protein n=1 Tax=Microbispora sp. NPDC046973 TaxID=3155022 RepID=UPI00340CDDAB